MAADDERQGEVAGDTLSLTSTQAAALLGVPVSWLAHPSSPGGSLVPGRMQIGRYVRWHKPDLLRFLEESASPGLPAVGRSARSRSARRARKDAA